ncbi:MAG: GIY-YIG nuclease family protein [candidate division NC10 bacterium]|nr:GIY-YIG nuclease family protein [candidate division NC10 bacterium]MDE2322211.1 GIY-YIG nuclease family protein [candidate division NC10 bacterium]
MTRGNYQLILYLPKATALQVGRRGTFLFPAGRYVYTGSALNGVERRLARHQRQNKRLHWHIDYFLRYARITSIRIFPTPRNVECALNRKVLRRPEAQVIAKGFGSSDCRCVSHLVFLRQ